MTATRRPLQRDPVAVDKDAKATLLLVPRIPPVDADAALVQVPRAGVAGPRCVPVGDSATRQEIDIEGAACGGGAGKRVVLHHRDEFIAGQQAGPGTDSIAAARLARGGFVPEFAAFREP